ncbi:hypothetical protein OPT61_g6819 [Boeremia exigua]|uniref:Uncharacterized protein n=1 Tax=Boeremia exigua TaxID=749465 RepID=A0ACC2I4Q2_9PLEO|nr:hypothetical protein OPT61_g6819 [Boeremia exigua]
MKAIIKFIVCGMALCFAAPAYAAPPPLVEDMQPFNTSLHLNDNGTVSALGYDPSTQWQEWAAIEVWTGGSLRKPVNVGTVVGHELHTLVSETLNRICDSPFGKYCDNTSWQSLHTKYLKTPPAGVEETTTYFRTTSAQWANDRIRGIMINIVGRVLYAYTSQPLGTNCYEVPGQGRFCNVPRFVRVHLPDSSPANPGHANNWFLELWGDPSQFSQHGNLKPCGTRAAVDAQLDRYRGDIEEQFPSWRGHFRRDTRVIIDGYKVCSDEP